MKDRRSFFKSLAMIGAAAVGCPGIFIPKPEPVRWILNPQWEECTEEATFIRSATFNGRNFFGKWTFIIGDGLESPYHCVIKPVTEKNIESVFAKRP